MFTESEFKHCKPEHELLLCCARTQPNDVVIEQLRTLAAQTIDWNYLFELARRHSIVPLVYVQLQNHAAALIPSENLTQFKRSYQENLARNLVLTSELIKLIRALKEAGIEAIPFKGPLLALMAYDDLALRRFVDLDVIVGKQDVFRAREVLSGIGYKAALDLDQQSLALQTQHNIQFRRDDGRVIVELHWEVASDLFAQSVSANNLWETLVDSELNGEEVKSLSVDDTLFSLCVHGSRHIWERISWLCDLAELISRRQINWETITARATNADCERMFYLGIYLADRLFGIDVPSNVRLRFESDAQLQTIAQEIVLRLFNGTTHVPATPGEIFRFNFKLRESWRGRARYFAFMLRPTDGDLNDLRLPRQLFFAYYLMRPLRLLFLDRRWQQGSKA